MRPLFAGGLPLACHLHFAAMPASTARSGCHGQRDWVSGAFQRSASMRTTSASSSAVCGHTRPVDHVLVHRQVHQLVDGGFLHVWQNVARFCRAFPLEQLIGDAGRRRPRTATRGWRRRFRRRLGQVGAGVDGVVRATGRTVSRACRVTVPPSESSGRSRCSRRYATPLRHASPRSEDARASDPAAHHWTVCVRKLDGRRRTS